MSRSGKRAVRPAAGRELFAPEGPWRWWRSRRFVTAVIAVIVLSVAGVVTYTLVHRCGPGVNKHGGECIGVTDGSYVFSTDLAAVEGTIKQENTWVADQHKPYVTVAFLGPLSSTTTQGLTTGRVPHQLEGAVVAQHRANRDQVVGDHPLIRLVLANQGQDEGQWQPAVQQLEAMTAAPDHLVAVVGLGLSQNETVLTARDLGAHGIPMVGDVITADGLDSTGAVPGAEGTTGPIAGLTRVAPTSTDEVRALSAYLRASRPDLHTAMLVVDNNAGDLYNKSLEISFQRELKSYLQAGGNVVQPFGGGADNPGVGNEFDTITNNICGGAAPLDMVLYAGREVYLPKFLEYLNNRPCRTHPIVVVTGSDAAGLNLGSQASQILQNTDSQGAITVLYTPLADPADLDRPQNPTQDYYLNFQRAFVGLNFAAADLIDGWAMMAHDAVLTAAKAIRKAVGPSAELPSLESVRSQLYLLNTTTNSVPGATGLIRLDPITGSRIGMQLAVMRLEPGGRPTRLNPYPPTSRP